MWHRLVSNFPIMQYGQSKSAPEYLTKSHGQCRPASVEQSQQSLNMAARFDHQRLNEDRWQDLSDSDKVASFQLLVIDYIRYLQQDPPESSKELQAVAAFVRLITPKTAWELAVDVVPALASAEQ